MKPKYQLVEKPEIGKLYHGARAAGMTGAIFGECEQVYENTVLLLVLRVADDRDEVIASRHKFRAIVKKQHLYTKVIPQPVD